MLFEPLMRFQVSQVRSRAIDSSGVGGAAITVRSNVTVSLASPLRMVAVNATVRLPWAKVGLAIAPVVVLIKPVGSALQPIVVPLAPEVGRGLTRLLVTLS